MMQQWNLLSNAIRYQKAATDNAFAIISVFQSSSEQLLKTSLEPYTWVSERDKEKCLVWASSCQEATDNLKNYVDKGYDEMSKIIAKPGATTAKAANAPAKKQESPATVAKEAVAKPKATTAAPVKKAPAKKTTTKKATTTATAKTATKAATPAEKKEAAPKAAAKPSSTTKASAAKPAATPAKPEAAK